MGGYRRTGMIKSECLKRAKMTYYLPMRHKMTPKARQHCMNLSWGWLLYWAAYDDVYKKEQPWKK